MEKIRIAIGSPFPINRRIINGGVEAVSLTLVDELAKISDIELHVVSCSNKINKDIVRNEHGVKFHFIRTNSRLNLLMSSTINCFKVRQVYNKIMPDLIHSQNYAEYALGAPKGIPLVITIHGFEPFEPLMLNSQHFHGIIGYYRKIFMQNMAKKSISKASTLVSIAGNYLSSIMGNLVNEKEIFNIPNPISDKIWGSITNIVKGPIILSPGTINERKNQIVLVQAFAKVAERIVDAELRIAGGSSDVNYFNDLMMVIDSLGLNKRVIFLGHLNEQELKEEYASAAIIALASLQETFPMVISQGMVAGKAIVATRTGGLPFIVEEGKTGLLSDINDINGLAEKMIFLLLNPIEREKIGKNAKLFADNNFASYRVALQIQNLYRHVLEKSSL